MDDEDALLRKELRVRKDLSLTFNLSQDNFDTLSAYNDYLERVEDIVFALVHGEGAEAAEAMITRFKEDNQKLILKNQSKRVDEKRLRDLRERKAKMLQAEKRKLHVEEEARRKKSKVEKQDALMRDLRTGRKSAAEVGAQQRKMVAERGREKEEAAEEMRRKEKALEEAVEKEAAKRAAAEREKRAGGGTFAVPTSRFLPRGAGASATTSAGAGTTPAGRWATPRSVAAATPFAVAPSPFHLTTPAPGRASVAVPAVRTPDANGKPTPAATRTQRHRAGGMSDDVYAKRAMEEAMSLLLLQ